MSKPQARRNPVDQPVHALIESRWSPVSFREDPVADTDLRSLFEAARWAASCFNAQPWRFVVARKGQAEDHVRMLSCLAEANQTWARHAPVLLLAVARANFEHNDKPNRWAWHDCGQALAHLMLEAVDRGLFSHAMAGFDAEKARTEWSIEEGFEPVCVVALGYRGDGANLPADTRARDEGPRKRKALAEIVFEGRFGEAGAFLTK